MGFWAMAFLYVGSLVLDELLHKEKRARTEGGVGDFPVPSIEEGQPIPRIHGTVRLDAPVLVWWGDPNAEPVMEKEGTTNYLAGYHYHAGMQLLFCVGPDVSVVKFLCEGKEMPLTQRTVADHAEVEIEMAGAIEVGLKNYVETPSFKCIADFYPGSPDQQPNGHLLSKLEASLPPGVTGIPAWRGLAYMVLARMLLTDRPFFVGDSPTAKAFAAVLSRFPNDLGLTSGHERIGDDANPACIIWDELTQPRIPFGGGGLDPDEIDQAALVSMGETLYTEGLGLSFTFTEGSVEDRIDEVLRHIDAVKYVEPTTGLLTFKLVRDDYDPDAIPVFQASSIRGFSFRRTDRSMVKNAARILYRDAAELYAQKPVTAQDIAAIERRGGDVEVAEYTFDGITTAANARKMVARTLQSVCHSLAEVKGYLDRSAWSLRPGAVIKIQEPDYGIASVIVRVSRMRFGTVPDGEIYFEGIEDSFATDWTAYSERPPSGWTGIEAPGPPTDQAALEAPRTPWGYTGSDEIDAADGLLLVSRGTGLQQGFDVLVTDDDGVRKSTGRSSSYAPRGRLVSDVAIASGDLIIEDLQDLSSIQYVPWPVFCIGRNVLLIGGELIAFMGLARTDEGYYRAEGVVRGCLDTVPAEHSAGADVWFPSYGSAVFPLHRPLPPFTTKDTQVMARPYNSGGSAGVDDCLTSTVAAGQDHRALMPRAPTLLLINGESYPDEITGELRLTWRHRNRLEASSWHDSNATAGIETGVCYLVRILGETGVLIHTESGLTGEGWTYPEATEIAESGLGRLNNQLTIAIWAYREVPVTGGGTRWAASWQNIAWTVARV